MSIELLRRAERLSAETPEPGLEENRLRFSLEYETPPDIDVERDRLRDLLGGDGFDLSVFDPDLPEFLTLQFPGVERRMSAESLFAAGDALVDALGLVSAVPDIATRFIVEPDDPEGLESGVTDTILRATCFVAENTALPDDWAVRLIRAPEVWASGIDGSGITVAQPDSGVADHSEINDILDKPRGINTLDGTDDPTDPLSGDMRHPGHGTATSSVVASRGSGRILGAAPGATVVPIRCLNSVVLGLDPSPVAKAILHAVRIKADVISMSLGGGFHSRLMARALERASDAGIICVAAAGNCVQPIVVFPANNRNTVALAGIDHTKAPWKGTSRGRAVDVAAPAANVRVARRTPDDGGQETTNPSQGTSYATALTAGVAAMWVQKWGRDKIRADAIRLNVSVNTLFRSALRATAEQPANWPRGMGQGIVNAEALMRLDPALFVLPGAPEGAPVSSDPLVAALDRTFDDIELGLDDWPRIGAETVHALYAAWSRDHAANVGPESARSLSLSAGTEARLPEDLKARLNALPRRVATMPVPLAIPADRTYAKILAASTSKTLESSATLSEEDAHGILDSEDGRAEILNTAQTRLERLETRVRGDRNAQAEMLARAPEVLAGIRDGTLTAMTAQTRATLEAIVMLTGRPAYPLTNGTIANDMIEQDEQWGAFLGMLVDLPSWAASVGRIDLDGVHIGTGFRVGTSGIMTNRHVLESLVDEIRGPRGTEWSFGRGRATIDFSDLADGSKRFDLDGVIWAASERINFEENLSRLDMAVLQLADGGAGAPPALRLSRVLEPGKELAVIGYPARPNNDAYINPETGKPDRAIGLRLAEIFGTDFGRKYVAPGFMDAKPGALPGDTRDWVFSHDCTTLGGNSGSLVLQFTASPGIAGLHFSGAPLLANKAHALGRVEGQTDGGLPIDGVNWQ